ncbi:MAG: hypothetical protein COU40_00325 [Candidatus Moranbacteria bacterium CG10_big_fil_rev_8_21_14_0_10_35_21]|nr:MAG: hypothetical protein COU40_00325 [Candidatus Moranbacteria bacterium CG10_big_fil_rev_8_21_14_0_10_35_21]
MNLLKKVVKIIFKTVALVVLLVVILLIYFNFPIKTPDKKFGLGVTFSSRYASDINLDWKETYLAILDDLKIKKIRLPVYWDIVEPSQGIYNFTDLDWQLQEARKREVEVIVAVGQKVPRWPECFTPEWAKNNNQMKNEAILKFMEVVVDRYKNNSAVKYWQVENEPFLPFGYCPDFDINNLDPEIATVRAKDPSRKIIVTDSGELSLWFRAAKRADIFGTTMYRTIWKKEIGYFKYPVGPRFFKVKYLLNKYIARNENAIVIELQAEPWIAGATTDGQLEEQFKSMNLKQLKENVEYAKKVGFPEIYLWGVEWWYWLKTTQGHPELWDTAKEIFQE